MKSPKIKKKALKKRAQTNSDQLKRKVEKMDRPRQKSKMRRLLTEICSRKWEGLEKILKKVV